MELIIQVTLAVLIARAAEAVFMRSKKQLKMKYILYKKKIVISVKK